MVPATTIVIATANRPQMVYDCIEALSRIGVPPEVEVLVVDAGVQVVDAARLKQSWPNSRFVRYPVMNMALQRNEGIRQARGEIVCFIDDDSYVQPGWWPAIVEPFIDVRSRRAEDGVCSGRSASGRDSGASSSAEHSSAATRMGTGARRSVGAVAGAVWCNPHPRFTDRRGGYVNWLGIPVQVTHRSARVPREVDWTVGANMAFRKAAAEEIGGLAEAYGIYDEDIDFGLRLRRAGWRVVFQPEAAVYHYFTLRPKPPPTKATEFRAGRNRAMLLVRNYGLCSRLVFFLLTAPLIQSWKVGARFMRAALQAAGHWAAYVAGMAKGLVDGVRNPVSRDRARYLASGAESEEGES